MVSRGANYFFVAIGFLVALVSLWILPVFHLLMPERFWEATYAVPPLALAAAGTGAFTVFAVGVNVTKRMRLLLPLSGAAALLAIGLYFLLIPPYSFLGAAWATAVSFAVMAIGMLVICQRIYPVPWEWRRLALAVGLTVALCFAALALDAWVRSTSRWPSVPFSRSPTRSCSSGSASSRAATSRPCATACPSDGPAPRLSPT